MKNIFIKYSLIPISVLISAAIVSVFIIYSQQHAQSVSEVYPTHIPFITNTPVVVPRPSNWIETEWSKTATYHNEKYGYSLTYPSLYLSLYTKVPEGMSLLEEDFYGRVSINIKSTKYTTPDEELNAENVQMKKEDKGFNGHIVLEKKIKVSGYDAIVTYQANKIESFPYEKTVFLIKDRNLFRIGTRGIDHERIWKNFQFDK